MPTEELPVELWYLLGANSFFLLLVWIGQLRAGGRLRRIEAQLAQKSGRSSRSEKEESQKAADDKEQYLIFQEFLDEDPTRKDLPKREQFVAFRKWRSEKGLNWGADGAGEGGPR
jgi:hypothetical protein